MAVAVALALIASIVAIVATLIPKPNTSAKVVLISLAVLTAVATIIKARSDESDKVLMQAALLTNLNPPSGWFGKFDAEIGKVGIPRGYQNAQCFHYNDGMTCFLSGKDGTRHATVVLDRDDIARLYEDGMRHASSRRLVEQPFDKDYEPEDTTGDKFRNKVGVLGTPT